MKFKTVFLFFVYVSCSDVLHAQSNECGFGAHTFSDSYNQWYQEALEEANTAESNKRNQSKFDTIYTIKVVFHLIYPYRYFDKNQYLSKWIKDINNDFNRQNADSIHLRSIFKNRVGNAKIRFVLADKDPNGKAFIGYTYTTSDKYFGENSGTPFSKWHRMKFDSLGGKNAWNTKEYLNIWVCNTMTTGGIINYKSFATPPNKANFWNPDFWPDSAIDGIVISPIIYENKNRSTDLTHEIAHYLGLRHVSGDGLGNDSTCKYDDFIFDTPKVFSQNTNCDYLLNSCKDSVNDMPDMVENFMDNTTCRNTFTKGQVSIMRYSLSTLRKGLATSTINKIYTEYKFKVYPTLTENKVNIDFDESIYEDISFQLFDFQGQLLQTKTLPKSDVIDLSFYHPGTYFIKVFTGVALLNEPVLIMKY